MTHNIRLVVYFTMLILMVSLYNFKACRASVNFRGCAEIMETHLKITSMHNVELIHLLACLHFGAIEFNAKLLTEENIRSTFCNIE